MPNIQNYAKLAKVMPQNLFLPEKDPVGIISLNETHIYIKMDVRFKIFFSSFLMLHQPYYSSPAIQILHFSSEKSPANHSSTQVIILDFP